MNRFSAWVNVAPFLYLFLNIIIGNFPLKFYLFTKGSFDKPKHQDRTKINTKQMFVVFKRNFFIDLNFCNVIKTNWLNRVTFSHLFDHGLNKSSKILFISVNTLSHCVKYLVILCFYDVYKSKNVSNTSHKKCVINLLMIDIAQKYVLSFFV